MSSRRCAALSLGSNLGDRLAHLQAAVDGLARTPGVRVLRTSSVYGTAPVGGPEQPAYLNAVVLVETDLTPRQLIAETQAIEAAAGRERSVRWGPRTLDIDVLVIGDETSDDPVVLVPHPLAHARAFVLVPWAEVDPDAVVPGRGRVRDLLEALPPDEVEQVDPPLADRLTVPEDVAGRTP